MDISEFVIMIIANPYCGIHFSIYPIKFKGSPKLMGSLVLKNSDFEKGRWQNNLLIDSSRLMLLHIYIYSTVYSFYRITVRMRERYQYIQSITISSINVTYLVMLGCWNSVLITSFFFITEIIITCRVSMPDLHLIGRSLSSQFDWKSLVGL